MRDEPGLIKEAKAGSVAAFTDLVKAYRDGLFRFLLTRCLTRADAEDALQDTLINAYRYLHSYNPKWRFSTWLYRIAIRNAAKQRGAGAYEAGEIVDAASDPQVIVSATCERETLWSSMRRVLDDEVYTAMWLRYAEEMSIKEVAATLDRSVTWTKVNLHRARKKLDSELHDIKSEACG